MTNEAIRVKALEWEDEASDYSWADGSLVGYDCWNIANVWKVTRNGHDSEDEWGECYDTIEEAKAACQADFARRVGECVEVMSTKPEKANTSPGCVNCAALQARCDKLEAERGSYREVAFDAIHDLYRIMLLFRSNPQDVYGFAKDCRKALMKRFGKIDDARSVVNGGE